MVSARSFLFAFKCKESLTQIVEDQTGLNKRPAEINIFLAYMTHIRIQRFRTGGGQKYAAENHKTRFVIRAQQYLHRINGVERL